MKNKIYYFLGIALVLFFSACEEENDNVLPPSPVKDVEISTGYGEVILSWTNPPEEDFYYVDITYIDSQGNFRSQKVSRFTNSAILKGFTNTENYEFTLTAYNTAGKASPPIVVSTAPLEPAFNLVFNTITMYPDFGGAIVEWENETGKSLQVRVRYKSEEGVKTTSVFDATESGRGYIVGLSAKERVFEVYVSDEEGNNSEIKSFTILPLEEVKIDKSKWSVVAYSSQEPAEGGNPNGLVKAVFDDDLSTYWHTQWAGASPGYPHFFVIDMGQEVTISRIVCYRRKGDSRGQTKFQFLTSLDGVNWEDEGVFDFDPTTDAAQSYRLINNPKARYFKYVALEGPNFFAFLAEITIYGAMD